MSMLVLVGALVVGGCSDDPAAPSATDPTVPTTTVPATTTTTARSDQAVDSFHRCMVEAGIDIEPIPFDAQGRPRLDLVLIGLDLTNPEQMATLASCSEHLSTGPLDLSGSPVIEETVIAMLAEFSECVRSQGVPDFPDPVPGFTGIGGPYPIAEIPYADPDLEPAVSVCRDRIVASVG